MWSRLSNLFSRSRDARPSSKTANGALPEKSLCALNQRLTNEDAFTRFEQNGNLTSHCESLVEDPDTTQSVASARPKTTAFATDSSESWAAAVRRRPLTYAHKLRLYADDSAISERAGFAKPLTVSEENSQPAHDAHREEKPVAAPNEAQVSSDNAILGAPEDATFASNISGLVDTGQENAHPSSSLDHRVTLAHRGERFAMLRVVARQLRPEAIQCRYLVMVSSPSEGRKLSPVIRILRAQGASPHEVLVCLAGERPDRTREALALLEVDIDMELNVPVQQLSLDESRSRLITGFGKILLETKPEWLVIQGDSATCAMASIAAYYARTPVARIDGGSQWNDADETDESDPAVLHHRISSLFASIHFTETTHGKELLVREGVPEQYIVVTGNTGVDAMHETCAVLGLPLGAAAARSSGVVHVLVVVEMPETIAHGLPDICRAIRNLATSVPGLYQFVWPVLANAEGTQLVNDTLDRVPGILLSGPANYDQYLRALSQCDLVLTDMEDVQEEAPSLGKPVLLMGHATNRSEALRAGITTLTGADAVSLQSSIRTLARKLSVRHGSITNPYGDGKAALRILDYFDGRQVLEFGRTALPRMLRSDGPNTGRLLPQSSATA